VPAEDLILLVRLEGIAGGGGHVRVAGAGGIALDAWQELGLVGQPLGHSAAVFSYKGLQCLYPPIQYAPIEKVMALRLSIIR